LSRRSWVLFLCGCFGILCLEAPSTLDWMLSTVPDRTVQAAATSAYLRPTQAGLFGFSMTVPEDRSLPGKSEIASEPRSSRYLAQPVNLPGPGLLTFQAQDLSPLSSSSPGPEAVPAGFTSEDTTWQTGAGCMPVPRPVTGELP
jgi:hypothetical protein